MADPLLHPNGQDPLDETLGRLSKKPGVRATLVLDRVNGAILKTSGQIAASKPRETPAANPFSSDDRAAAGASAAGDERQGAEELAALVWNFVRAAGGLVQDLDADDELKLLRLRTKKQELVIVPHTKFLLVAVHDTPPA
ncbi:hypothetical protein VTK73DRAFT_10266 [Phialemonium thermophilum]|uniref:Roadblock/LAMTOR2 domain-containing protein n=1 Tax=Phialemonium thermophilum TaxID=223376 RepID=A0ABR3XHK2_9PEZI